MPVWYKCTTLKEIFWRGQNYRTGTRIHVLEEDARILRNAGVIGDLKKVQDIEFAVKEAPENAKRTYKKKR